MRFSLRNLFLIIALLALACAGLMYRNRWWLMGITTLTLSVFVAAALMAIVRHGRQRTVLCGFSFVGLIYYFFSIHSSTGDHLPTTTALAAAARALKINHSFSDDPFGSLPTYMSQATVDDYIRLMSMPSSEALHFFAQIGHCLWSLLFATLAAWLVGRMYDRHNPPSKASP